MSFRYVALGLRAPLPVPYPLTRPRISKHGVNKRFEMVLAWCSKTPNAERFPVRFRYVIVLKWWQSCSRAERKSPHPTPAPYAQCGSGPVLVVCGGVDGSDGFAPRQLRNVSAMEVNSIRATFMKVLSAFSVMGLAQEAVDRTAAAAIAERRAGVCAEAKGLAGCRWDTHSLPSCVVVDCCSFGAGC